MSLVLLPGLGADHRLLEPQKGGFPQLMVPSWLPPRSRESLAAYAERLAATVRSAAPLYLGGVSFGGMVALEMARHLRPVGVFLIGSCRSPASIPLHLKFGCGLARRLPVEVFNSLKSSRVLLRAALGPCGNNHTTLAARMAAATSGEFLKWGCWAIQSWPGLEDPPVPVHHIHGDADRLLPLRLVKPDRIVRGGGHVLTLTHPQEVNAFLAEGMGFGV